MRDAGFPFSRVLAVSGSGQQHGSVFWKNGAGEVLKQLDPKTTLSAQLKVSMIVLQIRKFVRFYFVWLKKYSIATCIIIVYVYFHFSSM